MMGKSIQALALAGLFAISCAAPTGSTSNGLSVVAYPDQFIVFSATGATTTVTGSVLLSSPFFTGTKMVISWTPPLNPDGTPGPFAGDSVIIGAVLITTSNSSSNMLNTPLNCGYGGDQLTNLLTLAGGATSYSATTGIPAVAAPPLVNPLTTTTFGCGGLALSSAAQTNIANGTPLGIQATIKVYGAILDASGNIVGRAIATKSITIN